MTYGWVGEGRFNWFRKLDYLKFSDLRHGLRHLAKNGKWFVWCKLRAQEGGWGLDTL